MNEIIAKSNFKRVAMFQVFTALATSLIASPLATDMLMLAVNVDIDKFGVIKGNMYLVPALLFTLFSGFLPGLRRDLEICYWGYVVRCIMPFLLSGAVLLGASPESLVWWASISLLLSYTCATFANNMLVKVYRTTLRPADFNRNCVFFMGLNGTICGIFCFVWMYVLNRYSGNSQLFVRCYLVIQLVTLLFEYPAVLALKKVKILEKTPAASARISAFSGMKSVMKDREFILVLIQLLIYGLYFGALNAYVIVFLLRIWKLSPMLIAVANTVFVFIAMISVYKFSKFSERINYPRFMFYSSLLIGVMTLCWALNLRTAWINLVFLVIIFDGSGGIISFIINQMHSAIPVSLAPKQFCEVYIAFGTLAKSFGAFAGGWLASLIFSLVGGSEYERFSTLFSGVLILPVLLMILALIWMKMQKKQAPAATPAIRSK